MPVLAKGKTRTGRLWTYVRDDRPFAGPDPPAAMFFYSRDRGGEHPEQHLASYAGLMQADAYAGFSLRKDAGQLSVPLWRIRPERDCLGGWRRRVLEQMQGTSISDFLFADERLRILESTRRALVIRHAERLEAQRDGARTFEALLTVSTPLGVPRNRSAGARSVCIVQSGLSAANFSARAEGGCKHPKTCRPRAGGYEGSSRGRVVYTGFRKEGSSRDSHDAKDALDAIVNVHERPGLLTVAPNLDLVAVLAFVNLAADRGGRLLRDRHRTCPRGP